MQTQPPPIVNPPAQTAPLTSAEFEAIAVRLRRNRQQAVSTIRIAFLTLLMTLFVSIITRSWINPGFSCPILISIAFAIIVTALMVDKVLQEDACEAPNLLRFIQNTQDASQLGAILDLQNSNWYHHTQIARVRGAANESVPRLLFLIQSADVHVLNTQQRSRLRRDMFLYPTTQDMNHLQRSEYRLALLSALEQIGDRRDLPDIERLLKHLEDTDEVRAAAERCVQAITERLARENLKDVLLRPDRNPDAPATLLRSSAERADTAPQQLLRASVTDHTEPPV